MQKKGFLKREISQHFCLQLHRTAFFSQLSSVVTRNGLFLFGPLLNSSFCFCESVKLVPSCPALCIVLFLVVDSCVPLQGDASVPHTAASGPLAGKLLPLSLISELLSLVIWMGLKSILEGTKFSVIAPNNIRAPKQTEIEKLLKMTSLCSVDRNRLYRWDCPEKVEPL